MAEGTQRRGPARPLLGDVVKPLPGSDEGSAVPETPTPLPASGSSDLSDLME